MSATDPAYKDVTGVTKVVGSDTIGTSTNYQKVSANQDAAVMDLVDNSGVTGVLSIAANTVTPIRVGSSNLANRKRLLFIPTSGTVAYWSLSSGLTGVANGMPVYKNQPVSDSWGPNTTVYIFSTVAISLAVTEAA